jgi:ribosome-binding protein aMBF1 (putative translation factor)
MRHSLMVECYLCGSEVDPGPSICVRGLGPSKYVCQACVLTAVFSAVVQKHDEKNAASRRYLAKRAGASGIE